MSYIAGLDFGTSSLKLVVCCPDGTFIRTQAAYPTSFGSAGEVEQDPESWWRAAASALKASGVADRIDAIGLTGQMQDLVPVSRNGPIRQALLYSDTRATHAHQRLHAEIPDWEERTGNTQDVSSVAAKIAWLAEHEPASLTTAEYLLLSAPGYIGWRAGGRAVCDVLTASTTGLLDVGKRAWFTQVIRAAGAEPSQMPALVGVAPGDGLVGAVSPAAAAELGVRSGIALVMATGDAGSTTDGLVGSDPGDSYLYLGTTGWVAGVTEAAASGPSAFHSLVMPGWDRRLRIGAVQSAGSAADWARRSYFPGRDFGEVERRVLPRVNTLAARPLCLPGLTGERTPVRDSDFRGAFVGVHEHSDNVDMYLAVLTGVAMGLRHAAEEMGILQDRIPLVGGAASSLVWRSILANSFGRVLLTGEAEDPGCYSALRAVSVVCNLGLPLLPLFSANSRVSETRPTAEQGAYEALISTHRGLYDALAPTFAQLASRGSSQSAPHTSTN